MIVLTDLQKMILLSKLETMVVPNEPQHCTKKVEGMVCLGMIDPHKMKPDEIKLLCESINTNTFYCELKKIGASALQLEACKRTMMTLCTLLSMYKVYATFNTTQGE